jgi:hypothetical protein
MIIPFGIVDGRFNAFSKPFKSRLACDELGRVESLSYHSPMMVAEMLPPWV